VLAETPRIMKQAGTDCAQSITPANVIKREGGNWVIEPKMDNLYQRAGYEPDLQERLAELQSRYTPEVLEKLEPNVRDHVVRSIKETTDAVAMDKWLDSNMKNYLKNEMGTPSDPIRLMIEKREAEILAKFEKDQERAQRMAGRAEAEPDPRRKANMKRQAHQMLVDADAEKTLALQHKSHLPPDLQTPESMWTPEELASARKREGFAEEGIGKTNASQMWEQMADQAIYPTKAQEIQEFPALLEKRNEAYGKLADYEAKLDQKLRDKFLKAGIDEDVLKRFLENSFIVHKADAVGEADIAQKLFDNVKPLPDTSHFLEYASNTSPWISKVDPKSSVFSGDVSGLNLDHVVDVIKEDLAAGRLRPEKLNALSIEQAVRRTADYDLELAKKMNAERASVRAELPVYKEYPEGLRWVELNRPGDFAAESEAMGHSVRGYEPPKGHPDWVEGSGDSGYSNYGHGGWDAIKRGDAKVYSLVDSKGEPHVTVETHPSKYALRWDVVKEYMPAATEEAKKLPNGYTDRDISDIAMRMAKENEPPSISQIKGKQNAAPKDAYLPFVQDFVKSGNWSNVGDLENTGLKPIAKVPERERFESAGMKLPKYLTDAEHDNLINEYLKLTSHPTDLDFMHREYGFPLPDAPPPEGMKRGGAVTLEDLAMNYYVPDYNEDDYYEMPMALMPPQQRMSKGGLTQYKECNCHG